jgi:PAS domain S-box-containing protein
MPDDNNRSSSQDRWRRDLMIVALVAVTGTIVAMQADAVTPLHALLMQYQDWHSGEVVLGLGLLMAGLIWFSWRRQRDSRRHLLESSAMAERYRQISDELSFLISATPGALYTSRPESDLGAISISPSIKAQTGYDPGDFTGDPKFWVDHIHPDDKERVLAELSDLFEQGHHTHEYRFRHADGSYRWMHDQLALLRDQDGNPEKIAGLWIDITDRKNLEQRLEKRVAERTANLRRANQSLLQEMEERKQAEAALSHSVDQYQRLIDNLPGYVYMCNNDQNWTMHFLSAGFRKIVGLAPDHVVENQEITVGNMIHPDDRERVWTSTQEDLAAHKPCVIQYRIMTPSGTEKWVWDRSQGVYDADGNVIRLEGYIEDITAIKQHERELIEARLNAEAASKAKSAFLANTNHELRTPLNAIVGFSEMLAGERLGPLGNDQYREFAGLIESSGRSLLAIVTTIMELNRLQADDVVLDLEDIEPGEAIAPMVRRWTTRASARGITIEFNNAAQGARLRADEQHLHKIVDNLLSNAVKFSNDNGKVQVSLRLDRQHRFVLAVKDSGIGIARAYLRKISEPFFQADDNLDRKTGGIGLGLTLVKECARLHGATFNIASKPGKGTCVEVTFPATATVGEATRKASTHTAGSAEENPRTAIG